MHAHSDSSLIDAVDALLPQTQCGKCNYAGCRPYAEAIARGEADINQCPPGGEVGIARLAQLLQVPAKPLNPAHGVQQPPALAVIDEAACIGCTLCIKACPVDAIVGAAKQMHTVLADECTGCELCVAPCPVNCIRMEPVAALRYVPARARARHQARLLRLARWEAEKREKHQARLAAHQAAQAGPGLSKKDIIAAALARAKARQAELARQQDKETDSA